MLTVAVIVGIVALSVLTACIVLITVKLCEALSASFSTLDRAHDRWVRSMDRLENKLLTKTWEDYVGVQELEREEDGGFFPPGEPEEDGEVLVPGLWGSLRRMGPIDAPDADTERLLNEDFDEDDEPIRGDAA